MNRTPATFTAVTDEQKAAFAAALASPDFAYTRVRSWRADGYVESDADYIVYVYRRDRTSPSGVILAASLGNYVVAMELIDAAKKPGPLSPTEGLNKSGAGAY